MWTIELVIDPDQPDQIFCYLIIDEHDIPLGGHYDTYDDARRALNALSGGEGATRGQAHASSTYYPT